MSSKLHQRMLARVTPLFEKVRAHCADTIPAEYLPSHQSQRYTAEHVSAFVEGPLVRLVRALVPDKRRQNAVLDREQLVDRWRFSDSDTARYYEQTPEEKDMSFLVGLIGAKDRQLRGDAAPYWPREVSIADLERALERTKDAAALRLAKALHDGWFFPTAQGRLGGAPEAYPIELPDGGRTVVPDLSESLSRWPILACALIVSVEKEVLADLQRPAIAIDASHAHHEIVSRVRDLPKGGKHSFSTEDERLELIGPDDGKGSVQLTLAIDKPAHESLVKAIRAWRGWEGLRHWAAILRLLSVEGGRSGKVRWRLDEHIAALGYSDRVRLDPEKRKQIARQVELLTKIELAVYAKDGKLRARLPLLIRTATFEALEGAEWEIEGLELQMNPHLYRGVRDDRTGDLGTLWFPAPTDLAKIDHSKHPHALVLGLILPMRWRWDWLDGRWEAGGSSTTFSGQTLFTMAGIPPLKSKPGRVWETLHRSLDELVKIRALGRYEWVGPAWTSVGKCVLHAPDWLVDRTLHELTPVEKPPALLPATGRELVVWRGERGLSQAAAAKVLGVGDKTVKRAETTPDKALGRALRAALEAHAKPQPGSSREG